ncbi:MAG: copper homeostasis protein CutC [Schleiferiaceae bacterium]
MPATLELACFHPEAAERAQRWGVPRMEFCAQAKLGGTSPIAAEVDQVRRAYGGELGVMLRPRGGDFVYSASEFRVLAEELPRLAGQGVDFVVLGALTEDGLLDPRTADLAELAAAHSLPWVLHRAFDAARDRFEALATAEAMGCARILTGLGAMSMGDLVALREVAKLEILPGGGIRARNAADYLEAGFRQIHSAALLNYDATPPLPDEAETQALLKLCHQY